MNPLEYNTFNRGKIQYRERARQIIDFSGLRYKNITPTDIDGLNEYHNKGFVFYEYKLGNAEMPFGQRTALERLVDAVNAGGKEAVVFLCSHNVANPQEDVDAAEAKVVETYYRGRWHREKGTETVKQRSDAFLEWLDLNPLL